MLRAIDGNKLHLYQLWRLHSFRADVCLIIQVRAIQHLIIIAPISLLSHIASGQICCCLYTSQLSSRF